MWNENDTSEELYDVLTNKQLIDKQNDILNSIYSDEYKDGCFRVPPIVPKSIQRKIDTASLISEILKTRYEGEKDSTV